MEKSLNIKFIFDFLDAQEKGIEDSLAVSFENDNDYQIGYLQAINDFRQYLKQAIELTKIPTTIHGTELGVWGNPANPNKSLPLDITSLELLKKAILNGDIELPKKQIDFLIVFGYGR